MAPRSDVERSINHWVRVLSLFGSGVREVTVRAGKVLELTDDFFDPPEVGPADSEWFRIPAGSFEVFLDDDASTIRLANRQVLQNLHGHDQHSLVHWFGYKPESYDLVLHTADNDHLQPAVPDVTKLSWVAWDYRVWRTFLFDGGRLMPVTQSGAMAAGLETDLNRVTWMGWDGENLDVFTSEFPQLPAATAAVFVGKDQSILTVNKPTR